MRSRPIHPPTDANTNTNPHKHPHTKPLKQVAREREARARTEDSVRVDPICDVEFEGSMYRVVQLLDKVRKMLCALWVLGHLGRMWRLCEAALFRSVGGKEKEQNEEDESLTTDPHLSRTQPTSPLSFSLSTGAPERRADGGGEVGPRLGRQHARQARQQRGRRAKALN